MDKQQHNIAVQFPGIGYTCDKPLLYYSGKLAMSLGYQVVPVPYTGFPKGVKGDRQKMAESVLMALDQSEKLLKDIDWDEYDNILFLSKSVGTAISCQYARQHGLKVHNVLFTPVEDTFNFVSGKPGAEIAFHGTADPWAETAIIIRACNEKSVPLYLTENANHSLETGDIKRDIVNLGGVIETVRAFITGAPLPEPAKACGT